MFLTRPPRQPPEGTPFDLHALGTPPALILSQDQTLHQMTTRQARAAGPPPPPPPPRLRGFTGPIRPLRQLVNVLGSGARRASPYARLSRVSSERRGCLPLARRCHLATSAPRRVGPSLREPLKVTTRSYYVKWKAG